MISDTEEPFSYRDGISYHNKIFNRFDEFTSKLMMMFSQLKIYRETRT